MEGANHVPRALQQAEVGEGFGCFIKLHTWCFLFCKSIFVNPFFLFFSIYISSPLMLKSSLLVSQSVCMKRDHWMLQTLLNSMKGRKGLGIGESFSVHLEIPPAEEGGESSRPPGWRAHCGPGIMLTLHQGSPRVSAFPVEAIPSCWLMEIACFIR